MADVPLGTKRGWRGKGSRGAGTIFGSYFMLPMTGSFVFWWRRLRSATSGEDELFSIYIFLLKIIFIHRKILHFRFQILLKKSRENFAGFSAIY